MRMSLIKKIPNVITVIRIVLVLVISIAVICNRKHDSMLICLAVVYLSDFFDGYVARKMQAESSLGRCLDVIADGLFIVGMTSIFLKKAFISPWVLISIVIEYAVFIVTARVLANKGKNIYDSIGRVIAMFYYAFAGLILFIWAKVPEKAFMLHYLTILCIGLSIVGCANRLRAVYRAKK